MAVVSSVGTPAVLSRPSYSAGPFHREAISLCRSQPTVLCAKKSKSDCQTSSCSGEGSATSQRRQALIQILFSALGLPSIVGSASAETDLQNFRTYEDDSNKFRILVPQDWLVGSGETTGIRSVTAFYPGEASDTNVSIAITGVGPDFTRLESFGTADAFAENLVNGLDRSWKRPPGLAAKLIDSKAANGLYYIEYTLQNPGEKMRHIISAVGMASNGWYNRLYTVTGQFIEDDSEEKYRSQIEKSVSSFRLT
uniref:PsbP domain-containing protein 3, chloroplastic n=1 Tax=Anthurium amnicola TaxID=1678845 RepID=A0A1D1YWJ1_9ARAE